MINIINEICVAWYLFVNSNLELITLTIVLVLIAGLLVEVVRLKAELTHTRVNVFEECEEFDEKIEEGTVHIYRHLTQHMKLITAMAETALKNGCRIAELEKKAKGRRITKNK